MSQPEKVLHLYVEVRSAPDQTGDCEQGTAQGLSTQSSPTKLSFQLAGQTTISRTSAAHDLLQNRTSSRNSVNFQLPQTSSSPKVTQKWSSPTYGKGGGRRTPPDGKRSVVTFSYVEKSNVKTVDSPHSSVCGRRATEEESTPSHFRKRFSDPVEFGSPGSSCGSSPKLTFKSPESHQQRFSPSLCWPHCDAIGRAATQRAVEEFGSPLLRIKLAHALEHTSSSRYNQQPRCQSWSGSPVQSQNSSLTSKTQIEGRNQNIYGLNQAPASEQLSTPSWVSSRSRLWSCHESNSPFHWLKERKGMAGSPDTKRHIQRGPSPEGGIPQLGNNEVEGLNQLSETKSASPAYSSETTQKLAEAALKVSSVSTKMSNYSSHNALDEHISSSNSGEPAPNAQEFQQTVKMNIPLNDHHVPASELKDPQPPEESPHTQHDRHQKDSCHTLQHHDHCSPALPSQVFRPSHPPTYISSPIRDPRLSQAEVRAPDTPTLHRCRPPQYTGLSRSSSMDRKEDQSTCEREDCTELARRLFINQSVDEAPVSWTSRQQWSQIKNSPESGFQLSSDRTLTEKSSKRRLPLSPTAQQKRAEQRRREILLLGPVALESAEEDEGCNDDERQGGEVEGNKSGAQGDSAGAGEHPGMEQNGLMGGSSSRSSSGVTGSLGDPGSVSPESSQSSHQSNETGGATSGIQTDSGSAAPVPSLHCQKIARAKWEFLFGTSAEEAAGKHCLEASTAPPSGTSSESPTPTPPSSLPMLLSANHEVQHVEVELVTPPPAVTGTSPKTGIIRRTVKYSETDLDAIPLRCYRETDIDELLQGEQDDADSAFGSNRSVQGTSGAGSSPLGGLACGREDGQSEMKRGSGGEEEEEVEEEDEEEEMVSWASVRMQGDSRKQQYAAEEEPEVFGHLMRPVKTFFDNHNPAFKSPILVSGPRLSTEDTFSRHFESIMESHRAKGTSYNSLDSEELLTSSAQTVLTIDLPTLTPAIHAPVCQSARQIVQLSFAPLAHDERPSLSDSVFTVTGDSDATRAPSSERLSSGSDDAVPRGQEGSQLGSSWYVNTSYSLPR